MKQEGAESEYLSWRREGEAKKKKKKKKAGGWPGMRQAWEHDLCAQRRQLTVYE